MTVHLVGAGPGDPALLTVAALERLREARVVVYDRPSMDEIVALAPDDAERHCVGRARGRRALSQPEVNALLVQLGRAGDVVRLKSGDPFVASRGGEEAVALQAAGIAVNVIPGVSSALAAPAAAGIPLTHRGTVGAVHVAHGHARLSDAAVASVVDGSASLVLLMGVALLPTHIARLLDAGADPDTPVAVVERATLPTQRITRAPLGAVAGVAASRSVQAPAVVVLGAVAAEGLLAGIA